MTWKLDCGIGKWCVYRQQPKNPACFDCLTNVKTFLALLLQAPDLQTDVEASVPVLSPTAVPAPVSVIYHFISYMCRAVSFTIISYVHALFCYCKHLSARGYCIASSPPWEYSTPRWPRASTTGASVKQMKADVTPLHWNLTIRHNNFHSSSV